MSWQTRRRSFLLTCLMTHPCQGFAQPLKTPSRSRRHSSTPAVKLQAEVSQLTAFAAIDSGEEGMLCGGVHTHGTSSKQAATHLQCWHWSNAKLMAGHCSQPVHDSWV